LQYQATGEWTVDPQWELDENGDPKLDANGEKIPHLVEEKDPVTGQVILYPAFVKDENGNEVLDEETCE
jgi:hypothetical protein